MFSGFVGPLLDGRDEGQDGSYWLGLPDLTVSSWRALALFVLTRSCANQITPNRARTRGESV